MKEMNIKKIKYWAEEYQLPLFWLTGDNKILPKDNVLGLNKDNTMIYYYVNNQDKKEMQKGYIYFSKKDSFNKYAQKVNKIIKEIKIFSKKYRVLDYKNISLQKLKQIFFEFQKKINKLANLYIQSEAVRLEKFAKIDSKFVGKNLKIAGKSRLELRKKIEPFFYNFIDKVVKKIAKRNNLGLDELYYYTFNELEKLFDGKKLTKQIIDKRKKGYILYRKYGKNIIYTGKEFNQITKLIERIIDKKNITDKFTGVVANKGKAKGKVKLILHNRRDISQQVEKFKKGQILVTEMTRPSTIVACKKAVAIITDEGGILSHAAIISREFNIPCVIGAEIATKILHNDDLVEVDANNGVVKILKKVKK